jgi:hypothetical protein
MAWSTEGMVELQIGCQPLEKVPLLASDLNRNLSFSGNCYEKTIYWVRVRYSIYSIKIFDNQLQPHFSAK